MAFTAPRVDRFQWNKDQSIVRSASTRQAESGDGEGSKDVRILENYRLRSVRKLRCVIQRSTRRGLHHADQIVLVFLRNKSSRHVVVHVIRSCESSEKDQKEQIAQFQRDVNDLGIRTTHPKDERLYAVRESRITTRNKSDPRPVQHFVFFFFAAKKERRKRWGKRQS